MPVTLRRRPECHACGKRLNTAKREGDKITCTQCSADNYFDLDHNIIDVPENEVNHPSRQPHIAEIESESDIFCKKCLTNQAFYIQALANYLPDENHPQYQALLQGLPEYKRNLELRYPQCCTQCEQRSAGRIQEANYFAKSDHLRRLMQRRNDQRRSRHHFRGLLISAAGMGHAASLVTQLVWHGLSSQVNSQDIVPDISRAQCFATWPVPAQCTQYMASLVPISLLTGLLCIWWNPKWQHRLKSREGRLVGLSRYYQMQLAIMSLRFSAWAIVSDLPALQRNIHAIHTLLLILLLMMSIYAFTSTVSIDTTPLVDWQQVQPPLVVPGQFRPPAQSIYSPPSSQDAQTFNLGGLAGPSAPEYETWRPPTPPTDDNMDWAPTRLEFNPSPRVPKPKFEQKNPFYGTLPAAPTRGSLNPKQPAPAQKKALGLPPGFFGLSKSRQEGSDASQPQHTAGDTFAPARFFPDKHEADTGLESIFDTMFSVRDAQDNNTTNHQSGPSAIDPSNQHISNMRDMQSRGPHTSAEPRIAVQPSVRVVLSCLITVILAVVAMSLCSLEYLYGATTSTASTILPYAAIIPALHLVEEAVYTGQIEIAGLAISALQISLAVVTTFFVPANGSEMVPTWNRMVIGVVMFFLLQEIYHFAQLQSIPLGNQYIKSGPPNAQNLPLPFSTLQSLVADSTSPYFSQQQAQAQAQSQSSLQSYPQPHQPRQIPPNITPGSIQRCTPFPIPTPTLNRNSYNNNNNDNSGLLRKRDSDESISSISSINTTSTASGWKTPQNTSRTFDWQQSHSKPGSRHRTSNVSLGLGGLSLGSGSNDFGSGMNVAGSRNRQPSTNGNGRYRG